MNAAATVKALARARGFPLVGIARAEKLDAAPLERWLADGMHASLRYMAERMDERLDPSRYVPNAKSVVAVAIGYAHPRPDEPGPLTVARYARGRDYHNVMNKRLRKLRVDVERAVGGFWRTSADTAPVMEKAWAERAGLGWIGKNGCLINATHGSWLLLGTLIGDVDLAPDARAPERCGTCRLCLDACPTAALPRPGVVDARRCLAFHTIETREVIPLPIASRAGGRVFGCDECQDVCPWNARPQPLADPELAPIAGHAALSVEEALALGDAAFAARFAGTPLMRAGRDGFVRAALAVSPRPLSERARALARADRSEAVRAQARETPA